jgi:predicted AAA+ superfamily ATPase
MACYLLGITTQSELERSPFLGSLFEGFVAAEILKSQVNRGERKELYFFRDQQGLEVDFLVPRPNAGLWPIEAKASKTVRPAMAAPLLSLQEALGGRGKRPTVVHRKSSSGIATVAIAPGVEALEINRFVAELNLR